MSSPTPLRLPSPIPEALGCRIGLAIVRQALSWRHPDLEAPRAWMQTQEALVTEIARSAWTECSGISIP